MVKVYPRRIDLENTTKLKTFEVTTVVDNMQQLSDVIQARLACLKVSSS
jgi:flavoprotein